MNVRPEPALFCLLYTSVLAVPDAGWLDRVGDAWNAHNERDGITGLLVFDGHSFCQFVEGSEVAVTDLRGRLELDPRHTAMRVMQFGLTTGGRRFPNWRVGYAFSADPAAIERLVGSTSDAPLDAFDLWSPTFGKR